MTLLDKLQSHKGGLIHLKTQLYWFVGRGWDNNPGRVCLVLDATLRDLDRLPAARNLPSAVRDSVATLLLIDGSPQWVWVGEEDVEVLDEAG